jgi:ComF family protein
MRMFKTDRGIVNRTSRRWLTAARVASARLADLFFPPRCCLCGFEGRSVGVDLCGYCERDLPWSTDTRTPGSAFAPFRFAPPVDGLIRALKYRGEISHARVLGTLLGEARARMTEPLPSILIPVPLHPQRLRERGFNQAAAIARHAGRVLGVDVAAHALVRTRDTPSQTALDVVARRENVAGAFAVNGVDSLVRLIRARHVAVIDDVTTTGSTLAEARAALLEAGVARVELLAVAQA